MTDADLLKRLERCFDKGEVETLIPFEPGDGLMATRAMAAVKVVHRSSGLEATSDESASQVRSKASALLQLLQKLHDSSR